MDTEVTQLQYEIVMGANPSSNQSCGDDCPVENVTWTNARDFCDEIGARLPTATEFEYASRASTTTKYICGDSLSCLLDIAWYKSNSGDSIHPVATRDDNIFDIYDMTGNVWEWLMDWYDSSYYENLSETKSYDPVQTVKADGGRESRGGSYKSDVSSRELRSSDRSENQETSVNVDAGFRCARTAAPETSDCVDNGDGTITCAELIWQNGSFVVSKSLDDCDDLEFAGSTAWRTPTISELRTLIRGCPGTEVSGDCPVDDGCLESSCRSDTACDGCTFDAGPDDGCYWDTMLKGSCSRWISADSQTDDTGKRWSIDFDTGRISAVMSDEYLRCVRDAD